MIVCLNSQRQDESGLGTDRSGLIMAVSMNYQGILPAQISLATREKVAAVGCSAAPQSYLGHFGNGFSSCESIRVSPTAQT
jgi:hypothetical protein